MAKYCSKPIYCQYKELMENFKKQEKLLKETNKLVSNLNATIKSLNKTIENQNKIIEEQAKRNVDVKIVKTIKRYRYYPYENGKYYIQNIIINIYNMEIILKH